MAGLREQKKKETKAAIMDAARLLFGKNGFENTSIATLAKTAGIGKGTIYSYFQSKEDIVLAFGEEGVVFIREEIKKKMVPEWSMIKKLVFIFMCDFRNITQNKEFGRMMMREYLFPRESRVAKHQDTDNKYIDLLIEVFKEAQHKDKLRRDLELFLVSGQFYGIYMLGVSAWYCGRLLTETDLEDFLTMLFEQAVEGLRPAQRSTVNKI